MAQLYNLIEIIDYNKGKKIRQKEYFVEYFICQMGCKFSPEVVFIFKSIVTCQNRNNFSADVE